MLGSEETRNTELAGRLCVFGQGEELEEKFKEAVYIYAMNPTESLVQQSILNLEKGYEFELIWSGLNQNVRNVVGKKIKFAHL